MAIFLFVVALSYDEQIGLTAGCVFLVAFICDLVGRTDASPRCRQRAVKDVPR